MGQCCLVAGAMMSTETSSAWYSEGFNLIRHAENAQAATGAELQNAPRPAAADDFPQEKSPLEIRRIVAAGFFPQSGKLTDLEDAEFFCIVMEITQPGGENSV